MCLPKCCFLSGPKSARNFKAVCFGSGKTIGCCTKTPGGGVFSTKLSAFAVTPLKSRMLGRIRAQNWWFLQQDAQEKDFLGTKHTAWINLQVFILVKGIHKHGTSQQFTAPANRVPCTGARNTSACINQNLFSSLSAPTRTQLQITSGVLAVLV